MLDHVFRWAYLRNLELSHGLPQYSLTVRGYNVFGDAVLAKARQVDNGRRPPAPLSRVPGLINLNLPSLYRSSLN